MINIQEKMMNLSTASVDRKAIRAQLRQSFRCLLILLTLMVAGTGKVFADLAGCDAALQPNPESGGVMTFILALDGLNVPESIRGLDDPKLLAAGLKFKVATNLEALQLDQMGAGDIIKTRFRVVACSQRQPMEPVDIQSEAGLFLKNGVVLELWGFFDLDQAVFSHAILPIYVHGGGSQLEPGKVFDLAYTYKTTEPTESLSELRFLKRVLTKSLPLRAYTAVGVAALALDKLKYDLARRYYCDSRQILLDLESEQGKLSSNDGDLLKYVERMSREVIKRAKDDDNYKGVLGTELLPLGTGCGGASS